MGYEPVHLHPYKLNSDSNLLLIAIPAILFVAVLGLFFLYFNRGQLASNNQPSVLGEEQINK